MSFIKQKILRRPSKKPTAKFYVDPEFSVSLRDKSEDSRSLGTISLDEDRASAWSSNILGDDMLLSDDFYSKLELTLLPGEMLICRADRVIRYTSYTNCTEGILGVMVVTNFRVSFLPVRQRSSMVSMQSMIWKNKLYNEDDVILNNIETAYQVSKSRRRKLVAGKQTEQIKNVEIHCKDFRIHQFNFECAKQEQAQGITNAIAHFAFPDKLDRQFAFSFQGSPPTEGVPDFMNKAAWEQEVKRLKSKSFRVADCNMNFADSLHMPMFFVVPSSITNEELRQHMRSYEDYRVPIWSYTHTNGASLIRSTFPLSTHENVETELLSLLQKSHPEKKIILVYDVHEPFPFQTDNETDERLKLPSLRDIKQSHDKLKELCMPVTVKALESTDSSWYSSVSNSRWLVYVGSCLKVAARIAQIITGDCPSAFKKYRRSTIVIKEHDGARDMAPLITSLVQLILDDHCRTQSGFQALIEREWVVLGHRFKDRYGLVTNADGDDKQCPLFLLFLDCVHQLVRLQPSTYEFSEYYLILLWDCVCSGMFSNFIFNCHNEMISEVGRGERFTKLSEKKLLTSMLNVWDWEKQVSKSDMHLFKNPAYARQIEKNSKEKTLPSRTIKVLPKYYKEKPSDILTNLNLEDNVETNARNGIPEILHCGMHIWFSCYLRWVTPIQVVGGGQCMEFILESALQEEIEILQGNIKQLEERRDENNIPKRSSMEFTPFWSTKKNILDMMSSSFPYTPSRPTTQVTFVGTPMKLCVDEYMSSTELEACNSSISELVVSS